MPNDFSIAFRHTNIDIWQIYCFMSTYALNIASDKFNNHRKKRSRVTLKISPKYASNTKRDTRAQNRKSFMNTYVCTCSAMCARDEKHSRNTLRHKYRTCNEMFPTLIRINHVVYFLRMHSSFVSTSIYRFIYSY